MSRGQSRRERDGDVLGGRGLVGFSLGLGGTRRGSLERVGAEETSDTAPSVTLGRILLVQLIEANNSFVVLEPKLVA